jgi:serine/threonine protein kinase
MNGERWARVEQICHEALERKSAERVAFLDDACGGDADLRREVESLVAQQSAAEGFLETPSLRPGTRLDRYEVVAHLASGGMADVYEARDTRLGRVVAIKVLPGLATDPRRRRFEHEARAASALNHPHICTLHDIGAEGNVHFLVMERLDGQTLSERLREGPLPLAQALDYAAQIAAALDAAHAHGIVHRDLKPANIMLTSTGAKLLDFGLAKLKPAGIGTAPGAPRGGHGHTTTLGVVLGTLPYMAPEQLAGKETDARTDLFAFGCVLYEMLAGRRPFVGDSDAAIISAITLSLPPHVSSLQPGTPPEVERLIERCLQKDPHERPESARDFAEALSRAAADSRPSLVSAAVEPGADLDPSGREVHPLSAPTAPKARAARFPLPATRLWSVSAIVAILGTVIAVSVIVKWPGRSNVPSLTKVQVSRLTDSGRARDVAISRDGRYVVYSLGDMSEQSLHLRQVASKSDVEIVSRGPAIHGLTFSPDGASIYFTRSDPKEKYFSYLYLVPLLGGPARRLIADVDSPVSFSPDGSHFVFARGLPARNVVELRMAAADGSADHVLATIRNGDSDVGSQPGPSWSPDGQTIVCPFRILGGDFHWILASVSVSSGAVREIYSDRNGLGRPVWLSEGNLLIPRYETGDEGSQLWTISFPDGKLSRFTNDLANYWRPLDIARGTNTVVAVASTAVSNIWEAPAHNLSDLKQITFGRELMGDVAETTDGRLLFSGGGRIWIVKADGQREVFTDVPNAGWVGTCGDSLLFVISEDNTMTLARVDRDAHLLKLYRGELTWPSCSRDGKFAYYTSRHHPQKLWRISMEGGEPVEIGQVMGDSLAGPLDASPDGQLIAYPFAQYRPSARKLAVLPARGGPVTRVLDLPGVADGIRWSPGGATVQYVITQNGVSNVWEQSITGGEPIQLTRFSSGLLFAFDWSSDHRRLLLIRGDVTSDVVLFRNLR